MVAERPDEPSVAHSTNDTKATRSYWPDTLGVLWVVAAAGLTLVPALVHGPYIGSFDFLKSMG